MANIDFCRPIPETIRASGGLWLPELNVRLWRATYGAFQTTHNPGNVGQINTDLVTSWVTAFTFQTIFPDDWGIDTTLAAGLKMRMGVYVEADASNASSAKLELRLSATGSIIDAENGATAEGYITRDWTTLPTGDTAIPVSYQTTGSFGAFEDVYGSRKDNNAADVYIAFLES